MQAHGLANVEYINGRFGNAHRNGQQLLSVEQRNQRCDQNSRSHNIEQQAKQIINGFLLLFCC